MNRRNVTFIDDLPFLDDLDNNSKFSILPPDKLNSVSNYIRNSEYNPIPESGMIPSNIVPINLNTKSNHHNHSSHSSKQPITAISSYDIPSHSSSSINNTTIIDDGLPYYEGGNGGNGNQQDFNINNNLYSAQLNCVTVAQHTENCMVCSRLYKNDNTVYIIVIGVLTIISMLLTKRILES